MKILMIAPEPFFQPRGTPISVYQRLQGLSALGHKVDLVTYHIGKDMVIPGVNIHRAPRLPFVDNIRIGPSFLKILLDILLVWQTIRMLLTNKYDLIHSHEEAGFFAMILSVLFRKRHLYDMHSILSQQLANSKYGSFRPSLLLFEIAEKWVIKTCDALITIGVDLEAYASKIRPDVKQVMIENLPINAMNGMEPPCTVEELQQQLNLVDRIPVVYTGTFETYQGLDLLFESIRFVVERHPKVLFIYVGGKPDQVEYWQNMISQHNLSDYVRFVGTVSPEESLVYLELSEILVSPRTEGLSVPLKLYTYLYSGKPVVATKLFAHTQVLNDDMAVVVEPKPAAFAEGISRLIEQPELGQRLGATGKAFAAEKYNMTNYLARLERIYQPFTPGTRSVEQPTSSSAKAFIER